MYALQTRMMSERYLSPCEMKCVRLLRLDSCGLVFLGVSRLVRQKATSLRQHRCLRLHGYTASWFWQHGSLEFGAGFGGFGGGSLEDVHVSRIDINRKQYSINQSTNQDKSTPTETINQPIKTNQIDQDEMRRGASRAAAAGNRRRT